jgi:small-conductance mechanosensitive channel
MPLYGNKRTKENALPPLTLDTWIERIQTPLYATGAQEWLGLIVIAMLASVIGPYFSNHISAQPKTTRIMRLLDFVAPLLTPIFALCFAYTALMGFHAYGVESEMLAFVVKLCAAWFAVRLIRRMIEKRIAGWFIALALIPLTILKLFGLLDTAVEMLESLKFSLGSLELNVYVICKGIIALMALQWLASITVKLVDSRLNQIKGLRASNRALIIKIFSILLYCFVFLFAMQLLGINLTALGVFGGALGVGLGFGLQKIASNFISGIILLFEKSIEIGDLIEMHDGTTGYVRQTYARYTRLEMLNGKEILIPNEEFISQRVLSWTHTNKKAQIEIVANISYDADVNLARTLMIKAAEDYKWRLPNSETACYLTNFGESGMELRLQFWVRDVTRGRMEPKSDVMLVVWAVFKANGIIIPYPQRQVRVVNSTSAPDNAVLGADGA